MSVIVLQDGQPIYAQSLGMASIELARPNTPETVYPIGSLTKQFTAFCIHLLAASGKLALDADIHQYLPELPTYRRTVSIRMLLTHTSGIRDNVSLLLAKGHRVDDVTTEADSFDVVVRQSGLNYEPGSRYLYSNGNYVLLAKIVERVSGQRYAEFLRSNVFEPLSMTQSSVVTDPVSPTRGRATGYAAKALIPQSQVDGTFGSTGILSTVGDLGRWATQFHSPKPQFARVIQEMQKPGLLSDGIPITYASGVHVEFFHGLPYVEHTGAVPGFRSDLLVFPGQKLAIILLANTDGFDPAALAFDIASPFLRGSFREPRANVDPGYRPDAAALKSFVGTYELMSGTSQRGPGRRVTFVSDGTMLRMSGEADPLTPSDQRQFFSKSGLFTVSFAPTARSVPAHAVYFRDASGTTFAARRVGEVPLSAVSDRPLLASAYMGFYYSPDLQTTYVVRAHDDDLLLETPRGIVSMTRRSAGGYSLDGRVDKGEIAGTVTFFGDAQAPQGFRLTMSGGRAANLTFNKVASLPAGGVTSH